MSKVVRQRFLQKLTVFCCCFGGCYLAQAQNATSSGAPTAPADVISFVNGEQLSGELKQANADTVLFKSPVAGDLTIKWTNIKELRTSRSFAVITKNEKIRIYDASREVAQGKVVASDQRLEVTPNNAGGRQIPLSEAAQIIPEATFRKVVDERPSLFRGWVGAASADVSFVRATQNSSTFAGAINLVRETPGVDWLLPKDRTLIGFNQAYGQTSQNGFATIKTNIFHAAAERDEYFSPRLYGFGAAAFDHNFSQGLELQQQYGGGLGFTLIKEALQQFDVKGDIHYERQEFIQLPPPQPFQPPQNLIGSVFAETYFRKLPGSIQLNEEGSISPAWNNTDAYSAHASLALAFPVYHGLAFHVGAVDDYLNNAPERFRKNSVQFLTGVTYAFK